MFGAEQWKNVLLPWGTRLYEEYGRHESLQSCVKKHREAGHPSPEALGALEWLLLHHTPEVVEKEGKDLLNVLLTTVYLGCCNMEAFVSTVVVCLEGDPAMGIRLQEASTELRLAFGYTSLYVQVLIYMCAYEGCICVCMGCVPRLASSVNVNTSLQGGINHHLVFYLSDFLGRGRCPAHYLAPR